MIRTHYATPTLGRVARSTARRAWRSSMKYGRHGYSRFRDFTRQTSLRTRKRSNSEVRKMKERHRGLRVPLLGKVRAENLLLLFTLFSVIAGTFIGLSLNPLFSGKDMLSARQRTYLKFPGEMFMRMLRMLIVPLVVASNISSIASLNARAARMLTGLSVAYYIITTLMAVSLGLILVLIVRPGTLKPGQPLHMEGAIEQMKGGARNDSIEVVDSILDLIRNMIPDNLMKATFSKTMTTFKEEARATIKAVKEDEEIQRLELELEYNHWNLTNMTKTSEELKQSRKIEKKVEDMISDTNILGLITFSILFGFAVHSLGPDAAVLADMFHAVRRVIVYLVSVVIWFSPIGILSLIAEEIAQTNNLGESLHHLSLYVVTVMTGLIIHGCMVLPLFLWIFTKRNPFHYAYNMLQALMCALGTASSTATLPCTIRCLESGNRIDPRVTRFMLPLGTSINMDGTALYQAIAVVYIAQKTDQSLSAVDLLLIGLTATLASMASASMPSAGMITIVMVLQAVGLPGDNITILWPVDWFLDRFRTMVNVFSDSVGAAIVSQLCEHKLIATPTIDPQTLPNVDDDILELSGGLLNVNVHDSDHRNDMRDIRNEIRNDDNVELALKDYKYRANGEVNHNDENNPIINPQDQPTCVYVVDDETIVLKF